VETDVAAALGGRWSRADHHRLIGNSLDASARYLAELTGTADAARVEGKLVDRMAERLRSGPVPWMPGAQELLLELSAAGIATALVSSSHRVLVDAVLSTIGSEWFDATVAGDEVAATKPDPEPYLTAARRLGVPPGRCVVLEDSLTGAAAGVAAGCLTVLVPTVAPTGPTPGFLQMSSLTELDVAGLLRLTAHTG
jgi:HAD superfamily hydrolase (TIGR01509 family)